MRKLLALTAAALLVSPLSVSAQLTLANATSISATPVTASVGTTAIVATFNGAHGTTMVGPFRMAFGGIFGSAIHDIVCVDLNNSFSEGQSYNANLTLALE